MSVQITFRDSPRCQYRVRHAESRDGISAGMGWKNYRHKYWALDVGSNLFSARIDGQLYRRGRHSVALYAPGKAYEEILERGGLVFWRWLLIEEKGSPSQLATITGKTGFRILADPRQAIHKAIEKYVEIAQQKSPGRSFQLNSLLYRILAVLFELHANAGSPTPPENSSYPHPWRKIAWDLLENETGGKLSAIQMAKTLGVSASTLTHHYRKFCGESLNDSIVAWRMEKARILLADFRYSIKEIATRIGFAHQSYFSIFFKKATGYSPQEFQSLSRSM